MNKMYDGLTVTKVVFESNLCNYVPSFKND